MATVDVLLVKVVNVTVVTYLDVPAVLAVLMVVGFGWPMAGGIALVVVPIVGVVQVAFMEVVDVTDMLHRAMPTVRPMDVGVLLFVDRVRCLRRHLRCRLPDPGVVPRVALRTPLTPPAASRFAAIRQP
jgi:hypothetical protein